MKNRNLDQILKKIACCLYSEDPACTIEIMGQSRRDTCDLNSPFLSIVRKISNSGMPAADVASCLKKYSKRVNTRKTTRQWQAHLKYFMYRYSSKFIRKLKQGK